MSQNIVIFVQAPRFDRLNSCEVVFGKRNIKPSIYLWPVTLKNKGMIVIGTQC